MGVGGVLPSLEIKSRSAAVEILAHDWPTSPTLLPFLHNQLKEVSSVSPRCIRPRTLDWQNQIAGTSGCRVHPVYQNIVVVSNCRLCRLQEDEKD